MHWTGPLKAIEMPGGYQSVPLLPCGVSALHYGACCRWRTLSRAGKASLRHAGHRLCCLLAAFEMLSRNLAGVSQNCYIAACLPQMCKAQHSTAAAP